MAATIAIIDTGFDLDHNYLKPKIIQKENEKESIKFQGWDFFDNSHLKRPIVEDKTSIQEILLFRNLRAKAHKQGLSLEEFEWFKKRTADKEFMEKVRMFKKHSHGTIVAGIALREGENINIFPIRGLNLPNPVVGINDPSTDTQTELKGKTPEEKFQDEINQSVDRISKKFSKICQFVAKKKIEIVNASYGITQKSIYTKFRDRYREIVGKEIEETKLKMFVDKYFNALYERGEKTMRKYPNTLFVFSAGNSGLNNDSSHHYPSRIKTFNAISVAAMNGEYLATFSNYGGNYVDVGAPGVAILSIVPKVYSEDGSDLYSPSSGTSMAAPYVSNLAAQIKNTNPKLTPSEIKKIILNTGRTQDHLKGKLISAAIVDNNKAIRSALLSKDLNLEQAISLGSSDLIPMEDKISFGIPQAISPAEMQKKVMESIPSVIPTSEVDDEPVVEMEATKSLSSEQMDQEKGPQDNSEQPLSKPEVVQTKSADQVHSNQSEELFQKPSEERSASSSEPQQLLPETQSQESSP